MTRTALLLLTALALTPFPGRAQARSERGFVPAPAPALVPVAPGDSMSPGPDLGAPLMAGIGGGALGFGAGLLVGFAVAENSSCYDMDCIQWPVVGITFGEALGVPLGVHAGSDGRSDLGRSLGLSALVACAGSAAFLVYPSEITMGAALIAVPSPSWCFHSARCSSSPVSPRGRPGSSPRRRGERPRAWRGCG